MNACMPVYEWMICIILLEKQWKSIHGNKKQDKKSLKSMEIPGQLGREEKEYVGLRLAYPEKFWKTASSYYHSNKAWLPQKYVKNFNWR